MPTRLENLTGRPVVLVLAGGDPLRLAPGEVSPALPDVEVQASPAVGELVGCGHVAVHPERPPPPAPTPRPRRRNANANADAAKPA